MLKPYQWYRKSTIDNILLNDPGAVQGIQLAGYVMQFEPVKERFRFIRQEDTAFEGGRRARQYVLEDPWGEIEPIVKRTPQQRVESLLLKFITDCKREGRIVGLSDSQIRDILGPTWTDGRKDITAEEIKTVAAWFIQNAEDRRNADNAKRVVRI